MKKILVLIATAATLAGLSPPLLARTLYFGNDRFGNIIVADQPFPPNYQEDRERILRQDQEARQKAQEKSEDRATAQPSSLPTTLPRPQLGTSPVFIPSLEPKESASEREVRLSKLREHELQQNQLLESEKKEKEAKEKKQEADQTQLQTWRDEYAAKKAEILARNPATKQIELDALEADFAKKMGIEPHKPETVPAPVK